MDFSGGKKTKVGISGSQEMYILSLKVGETGTNAKENEKQSMGFPGRIFKQQYDRQTTKLSRMHSVLHRAPV